METQKIIELETVTLYELVDKFAFDEYSFSYCKVDDNEFLVFRKYKDGYSTSDVLCLEDFEHEMQSASKEAVVSRQKKDLNEMIINLNARACRNLKEAEAMLTTLEELERAFPAKNG